MVAVIAAATSGPASVSDRHVVRASAKMAQAAMKTNCRARSVWMACQVRAIGSQGQPRDA